MNGVQAQQATSFVCRLWENLRCIDIRSARAKKYRYELISIPLARAPSPHCFSWWCGKWTPGCLDPPCNSWDSWGEDLARNHRTANKYLKADKAASGSERGRQAGDRRASRNEMVNECCRQHESLPSIVGESAGDKLVLHGQRPRRHLIAPGEVAVAAATDVAPPSRALLHCDMETHQRLKCLKCPF